MTRIAFTVPVRTVSEANAHEHWRVRQKRAKVQRFYASLLTRVPDHWDKAIVTLTRIAPRALDSDNLAGSQKHVRDGIADTLGIDDRDPRVEWRYAQRRGKPREYAVEVLIEAA